MAKSTSSNEPLQVIEDAETGNRFVVYTNKDGISLDLKFDGEAPWFTQAEDGEFDASTMPGFLILRSPKVQEMSPAAGFRPKRRPMPAWRPCGWRLSSCRSRRLRASRSGIDRLSLVLSSGWVALQRGLR